MGDRKLPLNSAFACECVSVCVQKDIDDSTECN